MTVDLRIFSNLSIFFTIAEGPTCLSKLVTREIVCVYRLIFYLFGKALLLSMLAGLPPGTHQSHQPVPSPTTETRRS